jgi:hypothetical protein
VRSFGTGKSCHLQTEPLADAAQQEDQDLLGELDGLNGSDDRFGELVAELRNHVARGPRFFYKRR